MIKVRVFGVTRLKTGVGSFETDVKTLNELMDGISGLSRREAKDLVILVNGKPVSRFYRFKDGDEVVLLSPAGGG